MFGYLHNLVVRNKNKTLTNSKLNVWYLTNAITNAIGLKHITYFVKTKLLAVKSVNVLTGRKQASYFLQRAVVAVLILFSYLLV